MLQYEGSPVRKDPIINSCCHDQLFILCSDHLVTYHACMTHACMYGFRCTNNRTSEPVRRISLPIIFYILFFGNTLTLLTHEILNGTAIHSSPRAFFSQMRTSSMMANGPNANHHGGSLFASRLVTGLPHS